MKTFMSVIVDGNTIVEFVVKLFIIFFCLSVHECAHALTALKLGDHTGELEGRITLNPFAHFDLWGTMLIILFGFGYAKPVNVNVNNLRKPKRDSVLVALAGPLSNFVMGLVFLLIANIFSFSTNQGIMNQSLSGYLCQALRYAAYLNFGLMVFNLIPIPPLDGFKVVSGILPDRCRYRISRAENKSLYIILGAMLIFNLIGFSPVHFIAKGLFNSLDGLYGSIFNIKI